MDIALQEIKNQLEELVHKTKMDSDRITRELAKLENLREDQFERLARGGNDELLKRQLEETDEKINKLKKRRQRKQKEAAKKIREFRLSAENFRNEKINALKKQYEQMAEERDALRDEVIPELEQEIRELSAKKINLDSQLLTITSEINALNRFNIEFPEMQ